MSKTEFINAIKRDGLELALMYAAMLGVCRANIDLWMMEG